MNYTTSFNITNLLANLTIIFTMLLLVTSCSNKTSNNLKQSKAKTPVFLDSEIFVLQNGEYIKISSDKKPEPEQGMDKFYRDMYLDLRYPATARENGVQGTVRFEVSINEIGYVESIKKLNTLSNECDMEAERAINRGCKEGFIPFEYNGNIVKVKYLIPVNFRLQ